MSEPNDGRILRLDVNDRPSLSDTLMWHAYETAKAINALGSDEWSLTATPLRILSIDVVGEEHFADARDKLVSAVRESGWTRFYRFEWKDIRHFQRGVRSVIVYQPGKFSVRGTVQYDAVLNRHPYRVEVWGNR